METIFDIEEELKKLPAKPGVYIMHDASDEIIYVGKAISLKNRVRQYFQKSRTQRRGPKIEQMVERIVRFEYIITDSELEALVLECNLIKEHRPKYNTMLVDDKTYPFIKVTVSEDYPRVLFSRTMKKDKSRYFGPYTSAGAVKEVIDLLRKLYAIRSCNRVLPRDVGKDRPCLNYHIKQCQAPCQGYVTKEQYQEQIQKALRFLSGDYGGVIKELQEKMKYASEALEFERAIEYRELLQSVKQIAQKQKITSFDGEDKDVAAIAVDGEDAVVQVFFIRGGRLVGREHFFVHAMLEEPPGEVLSNFMKQYYGGTPFLPKEIMVGEAMEDVQLLEEWLSEKKGQRVHIRLPKKGIKEKLVELAGKNAHLVLSQDKEKLRREEGRTIGALKEIQQLLGMTNLSRIEAFDISNISGFQAVGSMVVYEKGKPKRSDYRRFRIRSVEGPNDYASMEEVLTRRFTHGMEERRQLQKKQKDEEMGSFTKFPDLIMMDGGKGQVHIAQAVLERLKLDIPVCGMVKDDNHRTRGLYYEDQEIRIDKFSEGFKLITRIQDEAHRFAITFHRNLRGKEQVHSILDDIAGIGPRRRKELMRAFSSIEEIRGATTEQLLRVPAMNEKAAQAVYDFFHRKDYEEK